MVDASQIDLIHVPGLVLRRKDIGLDTVEVIMIAIWNIFSSHTLRYDLSLSNSGLYT